MTTEQATQPDAPQTMADALEQAFDEAGIRAEVEATDVGHLARTDDERTLMRYLRCRNRVEMEITHIKDQTAALLRSLENRLKGIDYVYGRTAEDITRRMLGGQTKVKSIATPFGKTGFRTSPAAIVVDDESKLIAAVDAAKAGDPIKAVVKREPVIAKSKLNEYFKATGDVPAGCDVKAPEETWFVK